jgi:hypothetical protein
MFGRRAMGWVVAFGLLLAGGEVPATPAGDAASVAAGWLAANQNGDGSWGATEDVRPVYTAVAVEALRANADRSAAYFAGVAWLENHAMWNVDYHARRLAALAPHGDDVSLDRAFLMDHFSNVSSVDAAWGLSGGYAPSPRDTALALRAFGTIGTAPDVVARVQGALEYLKSAQAGDGSWSIANSAPGNVSITAEVVRGLQPHTALDPSIITNGDLGVAYLLANVTTGSSVLDQAQTVLAVLRWTPGSTAVDGLVAQLVASQDPDGSWGGDPHATALALEALAVNEGRDSATYQAVVSIGDFGLRSAVNLAMGRNRGDVIRRGDLQSLDALDANGFGISDLTGLEEATNLTYLDLRNTGVSDITPILGLTNLGTVLLQNTPWAGVLCDANADEVVDPADGVLAARISMGLVAPTLLQKTKSDVAPTSGPGDGVVDPTDVVVVMRGGAGLSAPVCN